MIGKTISHYEIIEKLGEGGMGEVYRAKDTRLLRSVALKILPSKLIVDDINRQRFIREAQTASSLNHPNICVIHDINEVEKTNFIVMEFVDGQTLREMIDTSGPMSENDVIDIAIKIGDALTAVHEKGILHRDIKPENIMISKAGYLKVMDFGLAKLVTEVAETIAIQKTNTLFEIKEKVIQSNYSEDVVLSTLSGFFGTVSYMSPEQVLGKIVDHRSDIFSLGILFYELLTCKRPFEAEYDDAILYQIITDEHKTSPLTERSISVSFKKIISRCLHKNPDDRYQSILELISDFKILKHDSTIKNGKEINGSAIIREPELRQMSIVFCEISNYDEIIGNTAAEESALVMNSFFELLTSEIEKHGGRTDKIIGGTILNYFGAPGSIEDSHKDAVNSSIAIRNRLKHFNTDKILQIPLKIKFGINTGKVIIETIDDNNYRVMGNTVSHASQLKDICNVEDTLVGEMTYKLTNNDFDYQKLEGIRFKGKDKHSQICKLISTKEKLHRSKLGIERQIYSVMVGRDKEFAKLKLQVAKLLNGIGSILSVVGEAGIGKSRLMAELKKENEIEGITFLEGRALSNGKNLSFHPLIDILKNWSGITEDENEIDAVRKLGNLIRDIYPDNLEEIFPFIATMMGYKLTGKYEERLNGIKGIALEKLILKKLKELFEEAASQKPMILLLEDLHWADATSIEFIELFHRLAKTESILFINVFRPNYRDTGEKILTSINQNYPELHTRINLEALGDEFGEILINNLLKTDNFTSNIANQISKRSGGNPFFIEEVVRSFIDEGVIKIHNGKFIITDKISSVVIPGTINEVIISRIDRLDEETKALLRKASVIGRNFFSKIIFEVSKNIEDLDERLSHLKDIQIIIEQKRLDEIEYLFKHALAHETVYESILVTKRKELHIKTAEAFEYIFADRLSKFYGILSYHYSRGENLDKAEEYLIKAGEEALVKSASNEAVEYFKTALNIYLDKYINNADIHKKAKLELNIGIALQNKGKFVESLEYFNKLRPYYKINTPKNELLFNLKALLGFIHLQIGINFPQLKWNKFPGEKHFKQQSFWLNYNNSINLVNPKRGFFELLIEWIKWTNYDPKKLELLNINLLGTAGIFSFAGISNKTNKKIIDLVSKNRNENNLQENLFYNLFSQMYRWVSGNWQIRFENDFDYKIVEQFIKIGDITFLTLYLNQYILTKIERGNYLEVEQMLRKMFEIGDDFENGYTKSIYHVSAIKFNMKWRKFDAAFDHIKSAEKFSDSLTSLAAFSYAARLHIIAGNIKEAEKSLGNASSFFSNKIPPWYKADYLVTQFNFNIHQLEKYIQINNSSDISIFSKKTIAAGKAALKNSKNFVGDQIEIYRLFGTYYWLINKQKNALKWWTKSIQFGEESGGRLELSRTYFEVGKRLSEKQSKFSNLNGMKPKEYLDKARVMFIGMDLHWDLAEFDNINLFEN